MYVIERLSDLRRAVNDKACYGTRSWETVASLEMRESGVAARLWSFLRKVALAFSPSHPSAKNAEEGVPLFLLVM